ncbi:hypothetical protein E2C01_079276 [Portunus trituberculatus]|uniref:Uncharacterized protein n=1 Tax=Portunus trituberculatus TaxID=210409 RepID=A0A5B7ISB1_PORTR|nr:hypothetical protein [Portunus trituberculatus]
MTLRGSEVPPHLSGVGLPPFSGLVGGGGLVRMACSRLTHGLPPLSVQPTGAKCLTTSLRPNKPSVLLVQVSTVVMLPLFWLMCLFFGTT